MATLKLIGFSGEIPKLLPRLLPDMSAQFCANTRLTDGGLEPIRLSRRIVTLDDPPEGDSATIYRHNNDWLAWSSLVHAAPGPVAQDRLYYTGDGAPKMRVNGDVYDLALPGPTTKLSASVSGTGTGDLVTRLYVYTLVTEFGEESMPSPISDEVQWRPGQTVTLSGFQSGISGRGITHQRIYRSQTGQGGTQLFFIAERAVGTGNFTDNIPVGDFFEPVPSTFWSPPPAGLSGLTAMPNGMMAAFDGKTLYFSEPYRPHAWPEIYTLTVDYPIVGLGAFGTSLAVLTTGNPYVASGTSPESMILEKLELNLPCICRKSIVDMGYAVVYSSHDGLVVVSQGGARVVTESLFSRDDWQEINPGQLVAGQYDGRYYASFVYVDRNQQEQRGTFILDLTGQQPFIIRTEVQTRSFFYDIETGALYYLDNGSVYQWDAPGRPNAQQVWHSKTFVMPRPTNFGALLLEVRQDMSDDELRALEELVDEVQEERDTWYAGDDELGGEINGAAINMAPIGGDLLPIVPSIARDVAVNVWADEKLVATVSRFGRMARLPSGFKASRWEIEVTGDMPVEQVTLATSGAELMGV
jgi:hypothetical protein